MVNPTRLSLFGFVFYTALFSGSRQIPIAPEQPSRLVLLFVYQRAMCLSSWGWKSRGKGVSRTPDYTTRYHGLNADAVIFCDVEPCDPPIRASEHLYKLNYSPSTLNNNRGEDYAEYSGRFFIVQCQHYNHAKSFPGNEYSTSPCLVSNLSTHRKC